MKVPQVLASLFVTSCATTSVHAASNAMDVGPPAKRTSASIAYLPDIQDFYTQESKNLNEQGVARVKVCYDANGNFTSEEMHQSSGFQRLDEAAIQVSRRMRINPGTLDGVPISDCVVVPVTFRLEGSSDKPVGFIHSPNISDFYPSKSKSKGEEGLVAVRICYDKKGRVRDAKVATSSGFERLDKAAIRAGKKFLISPAILGGVPVADCILVPISFLLDRSKLD